MKIACSSRSEIVRRPLCSTRGSGRIETLLPSTGSMAIAGAKGRFNLAGQSSCCSMVVLTGWEVRGSSCMEGDQSRGALDPVHRGWRDAERAAAAPGCCPACESALWRLCGRFLDTCRCESARSKKKSRSLVVGVGVVVVVGCSLFVVRCSLSVCEGAFRCRFHWVGIKSRLRLLTAELLTSKNQHQQPTTTNTTATAYPAISLRRVRRSVPIPARPAFIRSRTEDPHQVIPVREHPIQHGGAFQSILKRSGLPRLSARRSVVCRKEKSPGRLDHLHYLSESLTDDLDVSLAIHEDRCDGPLGTDHEFL